MTKPETRFDAETHTYFIDNRPVPSVTQVINDVLPGWKAADWYLGRGRANHACYAMLAQCKAFKCAPECEGFVAAWRKWASDVSLGTILVEQQVYSFCCRYAGTLDLVGVVQGEMLIVDFKGTLDDRVRWQLAAYALAQAETLGCVSLRRGVGVELREDGTYKMSEVYDLRRARNEFMALLTTYNCRRACGISNKEGGK